MRKACPFCGNTKHYIGSSNALTQTFFVHCMNCGATGPQKHSMKDADDAWDKRKEVTEEKETVNDIKKELNLYNNG